MTHEQLVLTIKDHTFKKTRRYFILNHSYLRFYYRIKIKCPAACLEGPVKEKRQEKFETSERMLILNCLFENKLNVFSRPMHSDKELF